MNAAKQAPTQCKEKKTQTFLLNLAANGVLQGDKWRVADGAVGRLCLSDDP